MSKDEVRDRLREDVRSLRAAAYRLHNTAGIARAEGMTNEADFYDRMAVLVNMALDGKALEQLV